MERELEIDISKMRRHSSSLGLNEPGKDEGTPRWTILHGRIDLPQRLNREIDWLDRLCGKSGW